MPDIASRLEGSQHSHSVPIPLHGDLIQSVTYYIHEVNTVLGITGFSFKGKAIAKHITGIKASRLIKEVLTITDVEFWSEPCPDNK